MLSQNKEINLQKLTREIDVVATAKILKIQQSVFQLFKTNCQEMEQFWFHWCENHGQMPQCIPKFTA
jgi:F0F1-type ATP synthase gamma subunit